MSEATPEGGQPDYGSTDVSNESGSGTPGGEEAANQPVGAPEMDHRSIPTMPASGTVASSDPQAASPARIAREAAVGGSGVINAGAAKTRQGQSDPPTPPEGVDQPELGVSDSAVGNVPNDRGRKAGAVTRSEVVGAVRPHAPDGEVSPT